MTQIPPRTIADHPVAKTMSNTVPLIRAAVLGVSVLAAIPTAHNLYYSWAHGIPFAQVPHRLAQYDLWMKNLDCKVDYRQLLTTSGTKIDVGACQQSGDIAIKVSSAGKATYEWIAFSELQKPASAAGLMGLVIPAALAETTPPISPAPAGTSAAAASKAVPATGQFKIAQAGMQVMCQAKGAGDRLIRIVQDGGKCFRETVSMLKGGIEKREEVPCTTTCK